MLFGKWFNTVDREAVAILADLCRVINNNDSSIAPTPKYLYIVRRRMFTFLINAISFNVHYKDLGHTNVVHMTNFPMYPLETGPKMYGVFNKLFRNTVMINGGYIAHCDRSVVSLGGAENNPFVSRRDFDLVLLYLVLTGKIRLSLEVCRSYLFKGSFNPLSDVFKCLTFATAMPQSVSGQNDGGWRPAGGAVFLPAESQLSEQSIKLGLKYCGGYDILFWRPSKIRQITSASAGYSQVSVKCVKVTPETVVAESKGLYVVNECYGLVVNYSESHPEVYVWNKSGIFRYDNLFDYLYSEEGMAIRTVKCIL